MPRQDSGAVAAAAMGPPAGTLPATAAPSRLITPILGHTPSMARVRELIEIAAGADITVMILGESGTGKELVARAVHQGSLRARRPFITVNCGAIPETLIEDELFGHVRGSFTGAQTDKKGVFEEADGGTLFLDEVGELSPAGQVKLLRVLQEREVRRIGETRSRRVNVRVISATNRNLEAEREQGQFREDLFHRLSVLPVTLPPLRERQEDVGVLARHFLEEFSREMKRPLIGFTPEALARIEAYSWPGNVRELENRVKRAVLLSRAELVDEDALGMGVPHTETVPLPTFKAAKSEFERSYVTQAMRLARGKVAMAARMAGKERKDFYDLMRKHRLNPDDFRD